MFPKNNADNYTHKTSEQSRLPFMYAFARESYQDEKKKKERPRIPSTAPIFFRLRLLTSGKN